VYQKQQKQQKSLTLVDQSFYYAVPFVAVAGTVYLSYKMYDLGQQNMKCDTLWPGLAAGGVTFVGLERGFVKNLGGSEAPVRTYTQFMKSSGPRLFGTFAALSLTSFMAGKVNQMVFERGHPAADTPEA
jgi:hypothetical protein